MSPRESGPIASEPGRWSEFQGPSCSHSAISRQASGCAGPEQGIPGAGWRRGGWTIPLKRSTPDFPWPPTPGVASLFKDSICVRGSAQLPILMLPLIGCVTLNRPHLPGATVFSLVKWEK